MSSRMTELSVQDLAPETLALLRRHNLLSALVRAEVVAQAVGAEVLSEEQCDQLWNGYLSKQQIESDEQLASHLSARGLDADALHWQLEAARIKQHSQSGSTQGGRFGQERQLDKGVYSLLVRDGFLAGSTCARRPEVNFDLAAEPAKDRAKTKGIVGPVALNQAHPALRERLRTSQPGQLLEPFRIEDWWLVARLERYEAARFDEDTAQTMAQELFQEWIQEEVLCKIPRLM